MVLGQVTLVGANLVRLRAVEEAAVAVGMKVVDAADVAGRDHDVVLDLDEGVQL